MSIFCQFLKKIFPFPASLPKDPNFREFLHPDFFDEFYLTKNRTKPAFLA